MSRYQNTVARACLVKQGGKMPKVNIKELLLKQLETAENKDEVSSLLEQFDFDSVQHTIDNDYVNPIVKKTKEEVVEKSKDEIRQTAIDEFIAGLKLDGVENVDGFKAYTKRLQSTTEEKDEILSRYEQELNEIKPQYENLNKQLEKRSMMDKIVEKGFEHKYAEDVYTIARNKLSDDADLDTVLDGMKESYKMFVSKPTDGGSYDKGSNETSQAVPNEEAKWREEAGLSIKK